MLPRVDQKNRATTGVRGLDRVLGGGLPRDRIYLVRGEPGTGKTTLALQFLLAGSAAGERCIYITLSETRAEIEATARSHGWSLREIVIIEMSALEQTVVLEQDNTIFASSEVQLQETTRRLLDHVQNSEPHRLVIDSLAELRLLAQSPLRYRRQILGFKQQLSGISSTVLLLDDCAGEPGDLQLQSLAHGVLQLEQIAVPYGEDRRRLRVVKVRGLSFCGGYHDFCIRTGGLEVFPRLREDNHRAEPDRSLLPSGLSELDQLLGGGLDRATSTLLMGPAGAGKSAIATQIVVSALQRGERAAWFAFDESRATFEARTRGIGLPVERYASSGQLRLQQIDPAQMGPGEFAQVAHGVIERGARLLVIDSLNGYLDTMSDSRHLTLQLHELLTAFAQRGVSTLLIMGQSGLLGNMEAPVDISYLSDTVLLLRYFEAGGRIRKAISVVKRRCGPHEDSIRELSIGPSGVQVGDPLLGFSGVLTGVPRFFEKSPVLSEMQ